MFSTIVALPSAVFPNSYRVSDRKRWLNCTFQPTFRCTHLELTPNGQKGKKFVGLIHHANQASPYRYFFSEVSKACTEPFIGERSPAIT